MMTDKDLVGKRTVHELETDKLLIPKNKQVMRNLLKKAHEDYLAEERLDIPRKEKIIKPIYYYIASGVLAIIISIGVYFNFIIPSEQIDTENIYNEYFKPYPLIQENIVKDDSDENLNIACIAYQSNKFALASELFTRALEKQPANENVQFYRAIAFMETGQLKQSIESFNSILKRPGNQYTSLAYWYTALTWIKLNNPKEAKAHLQWLKENDPKLADKSIELISKISK